MLADLEAKAPSEVKQDFAKLMAGLERGPYPGDSAIRIVDAKGFAEPNLYIASYGDVHVLYQVTIDQPVIFLVAVLWGEDPNFPKDGRARGS